MTASDFDRAFGSAKPITFTERVGKAEPPVSAPNEEKAGSGLYKPYGYLPGGTLNETCEVTRWVENTQIAEGIDFQYRFLMQVGYVGEEQVKLFLPDTIVVIDGMHLGELRRKLRRRQVTFICQYSPRLWPEKPPKGETLIENISIVRPEPAERRRKNE